MVTLEMGWDGEEEAELAHEQRAADKEEQTEVRARKPGPPLGARCFDCHLPCGALLCTHRASRLAPHPALSRLQVGALLLSEGDHGIEQRRFPLYAGGRGSAGGRPLVHFRPQFSSPGARG